MKKESILRKAEHLGLQGFYKKNTTCAAITKNYFLFFMPQKCGDCFCKTRRA